MDAQVQRVNELAEECWRIAHTTHHYSYVQWRNAVEELSGTQLKSATMIITFGKHIKGIRRSEHNND